MHEPPVQDTEIPHAEGTEEEAEDSLESKEKQENFFTKIFSKQIFKRDRIDVEGLRREQQENEEADRYIIDVEGNKRQYYNMESESLQHALAVQKNLNQAIVMTSEVVNKALDRGDTLQDIEKQVLELQVTTEAFMKNAQAAQNALWWKNKKMGFLLGGGGFTMMLAAGFCVWFFLLR